MTNFIPIFPLNLVVFPGEELNLHIFEPRYKQLINECLAEKKEFGIPAFIDSHIKDFGTLMSITEVKQVYDDGRMDICTRGIQLFSVLEIIKEIPGKQYSGAIVTYPNNEIKRHPIMAKRVLEAVRQLHKLLKINKDLKKPDDLVMSYDLAHHVGFTPAEEYNLLQLLREDQRLEYLKRHLAKVLPIIQQMEVLKELVKQNGHFKELKSLGLE